MILIISSNDDYSTSNIIDWLRYFKLDFVRISSSYPAIIETVDLSNLENCSFWIRGKCFKISDFTWVWYRRSWLILEEFKLFEFPDKQLMNSINVQLENERVILQNLFLKILKQKSLNSQLDNSISKLEEIVACNEIGLKTPASIVTTNKKDLLSFFDANNQEIITKNFSQGIFVESKKYGLVTSTIKVTKKMIDSLDEIFFPMYFQELITKAFEIRSFYIEGVFFSCAIFSQNDEKTKIDFRNYNYEKPNRTPPFRIPIFLEKKVTKLMKKLNLNSGSIDILVTPQGEYYFLEVNPVGQFFQVSKPCNYRIEEKIAKYLLNKPYVEEKNQSIYQVK